VPYNSHRVTKPILGIHDATGEKPHEETNQDCRPDVRTCGYVCSSIRPEAHSRWKADEASAKEHDEVMLR